ncbi:MAG: hypothetical protein V3R84_06740 [Acidimicrobiia bacterium]
MRPSQIAALAALTERFVDIPFLVGGSAMLALLGADVEPGDLDLVVAADSRDALEAAAGDWWQGAHVETGHPALRSVWLAHLDVHGEQVEVIGGLALVSNDIHWQVPMRSGGEVEVAGRTVRLAAVGPWVVLYTLYNPSRVAELLPYLTASERQKTLMELEPGMGIEWSQTAPLLDPEETR